MSAITIHPTYLVKGFVIPIREDKKPSYTYVFDGNRRKTLYNALSKILETLLKFYVDKKKVDGLSSAEELVEFTNLVYLVLRNSLYKGIQGGVIPSPSTIFIGWYIYRAVEGADAPPLYTSEGIRHLIDTKKGDIFLVDILYKKYDELITLLNNSIDTYKDLDSLLDDLLFFPADSRVGSNTSSLLIHTIMVGGLALSLYLESVSSPANRDLAYLKVLSLFHDVGKLLSIRHHESISAGFIKKLFGNVVKKGSEADAVIEEVVETLANKDSLFRRKELYKFYKDADRMAAAADRMKNLVKILLSDKSKKRLYEMISRKLGGDIGFDEGFEKIFTDMSFWDEISRDVDLYRELTEDFCLNASKVGEVHGYVDKDVLSNDVEAVFIDIQSIQSYVRSSDIRSMIGGSFLIDMIIYASIPEYIMDNLDLGIENIWLNGGGNLLLTVPKKLVDMLSDNLAKMIRNAYYIDLSIASSPLYSDLRLIFDTLGTRHKELKHTKISGVGIYPSFEEKCGLCVNRPATKPLKKDVEIYVCDTCKLKYDVGSVLHFWSKVGRITTLFGQENIFEQLKSLDEARRLDFMELIANGTLDPKNLSREAMNIAMVKFDGALIGLLSSSSLSLTDSFERSVRIDMAVKESINKFLDYVRDNIDGGLYASILLGIIYVGGDDGAIIMPSYIAPFFTVYVANEYYLNMGGKSVLSFSIIGVKYKHPVYHLYQAASYLLDSHGKKLNRGELELEHVYDIRYKVYNELYNEKILEYGGFRGSLAFYASDTGIVSTETLENILLSLEKDRSSIQYSTPYLISDDEVRSIFKLFTTVSKAIDADSVIDNIQEISLDKIGRLIKNLQRSFTKVKHGRAEQGALKRLKEVKKRLFNSVSIRIAYSKDIRSRVIHSISYVSNVDDIESVFGINDLKNIIISHKDFLGLCSADLLLMLKLTGGGLGGI